MEILEFLKLYGSQLSAMCVALTFLFGVYKFFTKRKLELYWKEFDIYHKLVKELVEPSTHGKMYLDRQTAILFELKNFKRYYPHTLRMLKHLLIEELNLTIEHIEKNI